MSEVYSDAFTTPPPSVTSPPPDILKGIPVDDGTIAALIGGVTGALLLALICFIAVLLWCLSRHKGSYVTNELDDDDVDDDEEESVASDTALQSKEPLKSQEEDEDD
ncbi:glycophorin-C-like [Sphaeramia orbicularis]|uniref:glycophorin-C-like n=1 Tax=Sphaeramia orbicularis TaxID=375764 RepID=UPI00117CEF93|nr:glycophorin-C-like [Sphaeramia orbicularis]